MYRWAQRYTPLLIDATRPRRHAPGDRWFGDETYIKIAGRSGWSEEFVESNGGHGVTSIYLIEADSAIHEPCPAAPVGMEASGVDYRMEIGV